MRIQDSAVAVYVSRAVQLIDYRCPVAEPKLRSPETAFSQPTIVFPRRGVFFSHQGSRTLLGDANHVLFFDRGEPFRISYPIEGGDDSTFLSIGPHLLIGILEETAHECDPARARFPAACGLAGARLYLGHRLLLEGIGRGLLADPIAIEESVLTLAGAAILASNPKAADSRPARRETRKAHRETAAAVAARLADCLHGPVGLEDLAKEVGASPYHLCRIFRHEAGVTIHRYLNRLRLREALDRLLEPATDLTALALDVGFSSHSHFTDAFRREFGLVPSEIRRIAETAPLAGVRRSLVA
jgi:AraC-like DNA-binding protein